MKISPDIISKLHEIDCESLAKTLGLSVKGHRASCFMHVDRNPSLSFKGESTTKSVFSHKLTPYRCF